MARKPISIPQVRGEAFQKSQYQQRVVSGETGNFSVESPPSHSLMGKGLVVLAVGIVLAFLFSFINPSPDHGKADLIRTKSGGLFVAVAPNGDANGQKVLHEVRNLASARLITGSPDDPTTVGDDVISQYPRGPLMGIEGAPNNLDAHPSSEGSYWGVCDWHDSRSNLSLTESENLQTTVVAGNIWTGGETLDKSTGILVRPADNQGQLNLIYGNRVAVIDENDYPMLDALGITRTNINEATVVSRGLLGAITRSPDLKAPPIASNGQPSSEVKNARVGDVLRTDSGEYVVLSNGVQKVTPLMAKILTAHGGATIEVPASEAANHPQRDAVDLDTFPTVAPKIITPDTTCLAWHRGAGANSPTTRILYADTLPVSSTAASQAVKTLPTANSSSEVADRFISKPGLGWFTRVTGNGNAADEESQVAYISDTGVRYDIKPSGEKHEYTETLDALGLTGDPTLIPDGIARIIPRGPDLDREAAMVESIGTPTTPEPGAGGGTDPSPNETATPSESATNRQTEAPSQSETPSESSSAAPPTPGEPTPQAEEPPSEPVSAP